ncbi:MAG: DUF1648 domain-containing protein [Burkholderiaceae bacterium]
MRLPALGLRPLAALLAALLAFIWVSSLGLPPIVASHFDAAGRADGFMPRGAYALLMSAVVAGLPLLVALLPTALMGRDGRNLNIPHRAYWLAPQRRKATLAFIRHGGRWFAVLLALFMALLHWQVVQAQTRQPPRLADAPFWLWLALLLGATAAWIAVLLRRFRRPG